MVYSHRRHRLCHENTYNFAQNFDQNRLLGEKLCQNENRTIKNVEIDFFDLDFSISIDFSMIFFWFFWSQKFSKKLKIFIFDCFISKKCHWKLYEKWKSRDRKKTFSKFSMDRFSFWHNFAPNKRFWSKFCAKLYIFHCGGDGAGENPPFEALRRALRIRMSSIPPASYIVTF